MIWTERVTEALEKSNFKDRMAELERNKKVVWNILAELTQMCLEEWGPLKRTRIETLVTIHVHHKEIYQIVMDLAKQHKIKDANDFEWARNTRLYWKQETGHIVVQVTDVEFTYQYEFLGAKERLCVTPLTDRCYVTLS